MKMSKWFFINRNDQFEFKTGKLKGFTCQELYTKYQDKFIELLDRMLNHPEVLEIDVRNIKDILKEIKRQQ